MHILFWTPPWPVNGDPKFFRQAFRKHLCAQANVLVGYADKISVVVPPQFGTDAETLDNRINVIELPLSMSRLPSTAGEKLYQKLYQTGESSVSTQLAEQLREHLPEKVDVVLQWENPVPYLENLYPDALIVNQMPGVFSRPPYPHTVIFDPIGLYRDGILHGNANDIQRGQHLTSAESTLSRDFISNTKTAMNCFSSVAEKVMQRTGDFERTALLPLQASKHYAFAIDSGFSNQMEMMWSVLEKLDPATAMMVTQYRNGLVADTPLDSAVAASFQSAFPNFIYDANLEDVDSVSQYLLPHVDEVISASSSLGLQGMIWQCKLEVIGETFLQNYATSASIGAEIPWDQRCENTISTILSRHQPLASAVTKDGSFLMSLIEDLCVRKASGNQGLERLASFSSIDPNYQDRLMGEFRIERAARSLGVSVNQPDMKSNTILQFKKIIEEKPVKAISFDIFDTLICRSVEKPADLYRFLERDAMRLSGGVAADFARVRTFCEVETRERLADHKDEITLLDIYETIADYYGSSTTNLLDLMQAEIEMEVDHCRVRPFGKNLFDFASTIGCPIYLISDMYLPHEVIARMLFKAGYDKRYSKMFVSCDYDSRKHSGALYDVVLKTLSLKPDQLVHVGDNKRTDIQMAEAKGIRAFRWSSSIEWMRNNAVYKNIYSPRAGAGEKARSAIAGTIARGMFDSPTSKECHVSLSGGDSERLGYATLGPLITGYMQWLGREARRDGISDLFFIAREGWLLKQVFDRLHPPETGGPKTHYLLGSRRSVRVAACRTATDVMAFLAMPYDPGVPLVKLIEGRFGLLLGSDDQDRLAAVGASNPNMKLDRSIEHRRILCSVAQEFMAEILTNAETERTAYLKYLNQLGFTDAASPGIVDVGWKANIQGALGDLTGKRTYGYYYATLQDSENWIHQGDTHRAYSGIVQSGPVSKSIILQNRHVIEFMLCHSSRSLVAIRDKGTELQPVYRKEENLNKRREFIDKLHRGAIEFSNQFHDGFHSHLDQIYVDPTLAESALSHFLLRPHKLDAQLFAGQAFEDSVGGIEQKFVVAPNHRMSETQSVWRIGARAVYKATPKNVEKRTASRLDNQGTKIEAIVVKRFSSAKKHAKYENDRQAFFEDSASSLMKLYWKTIGGRHL